MPGRSAAFGAITLLTNTLRLRSVPLVVYNVRTRSKEPFVPLDPAGKRVGMYVCGLTVYDQTHIGHARTYVAFEVIRRWLERSYELRYVKNVTDVEDKIINRAQQLGISPREHSAKWDRLAEQSLARLGVRPPDEAPHVTECIADILRFIEAIAANGFAYVTGEGNVYFDVQKYDAHCRAAAGTALSQSPYGSLSNRDYREMAAGTRKDVEADKRHPADFALWKAGEAGEHPDANWDPEKEVPGISGQGGRAQSAAAADGGPIRRKPLQGIRLGRPGWHIECSLMATRALGDVIDLHGGGQDLIFPHHENEIAQSQAKTGKAPFVNYWLHTGFLNVEGEKMSKSLGNFIVLDELLDELAAAGRGADTLRLYFLQTLYRSKIDFSRKGLDEAGKALDRLERTRSRLAEAAAAGRIGCADVDPDLLAAADALRRDFAAAMDDDFATPTALAMLFNFQRPANAALETGLLGSEAARRALAAFEECGRFLTLFERPPHVVRIELSSTVPDALRAAAQDLGVALDGARDEAAAVDVMVKARDAARGRRDWKESDRIRDRLKAAGYAVEDTPRGTKWTKA